MANEKVQFIPFHAINEFMVEDFRREVLQTVFGNLQELSNDRRGAINGMVKRFVSVQGFRNSAQAPSAMKAKGSNSTFQKVPDFTAQILQAWSELKPDLRQQVYDLLQERGWEILPPETDRTKLPGFLIGWPKKETYDTLGEGFTLRYPDTNASDNDIRLMAVWVGGRLPYGMGEDVDEEEEGTVED